MTRKFGSPLSPFAARSPLGRCLQQWGVVPAAVSRARLDVLLFSAGCAAIMHCYSDANGQHRDVFRSKYLNVLDVIFGNTGEEEGVLREWWGGWWGGWWLHTGFRPCRGVQTGASPDPPTHAPARATFKRTRETPDTPGSWAPAPPRCPNRSHTHACHVQTRARSHAGLAEGAITHQPSNQDLITSVRQRLRSLSVQRLDAASGLLLGGSKGARSHLWIQM